MQVSSPSFLEARFEAQRQAFAAESNPPLSVRMDRLNRLLALTENHESDFVRAIDADFAGRSAHETRLAELFVVRAGIRHARKHLKHWMSPQRVVTGLHFRPGYNRLLRQPLGVVGIVSPWNYPIQLSLGPALAAIAAGNRVLLKPSELTPRFCELLDHLVSASFAPDEMSVVNGGVDVARAFAGLPFDHMFFTGSTQVGRQVAQAAAANLTPVTLELGGKSPAILDASCDFAAAVASVAYGKFLNAGQTCIAPDYLLVPTGMADSIADQLKAAITRLYPTLVSNPDYTAIISTRHRERLMTILQEARDSGARIVEVNAARERFDENTRKFPPTLVVGAPPSTRLMREEIFGPLLPIIEYDGLDAAIAMVNRGDRPLALYWFGRSVANRDRVLNETISGGVTINDCLWHLAQEAQPFGGVGASGMGAYHGEWGFRTFSNERPVFYQARLNGTRLFHPPYGKTFNLVLWLIKRIA
ncbi:coniferyl aldehyde dehydrogenase [Caballeronia sp. 15711]|uniref:coniferyl aldehyde dehydrogenase n=1 Tax=Caballeronia sp. 15711 TaxID=3391029 RepID=UPI0039E57E40